MIVPTRDDELPFFARLRKRFIEEKGVQIPVSSVETIETVNDKRRFTAFCLAHGIPTLPALSREEALRKLPVFARPRRGGGGRGAGRLETSEAVSNALAADQVLVEWIQAPEYTVDMLRDLSGSRTLGLAVRRREEVRHGEAWRSTIVSHPALAAMAERLAGALRLVGHVNLQFFDHPDRGILAIEVNPRFGGGSNLSIVAGLNSPAILLRMAMNPHLTPPSPRVKIGCSNIRYTDDLIIDARGRLLQGGW
jgi:carbamoyl-phosphate synthase large subunit